MEVVITKRDIISGYIAKGFLLGANIIVLPFILSILSADEIGMNYIMASVAALVQLADFGFSTQIGRNITYVISGSKQLFKKEIETTIDNNVDFHLLATVIETSKYIYRRIAYAVLFIMLTFGSLYMYKATEGFTNVSNSLIIWILYSVSTFFNFYFLYYNSLLTGAGKVRESNIATILTKSTYIVICFCLLFAGFGLLSIVIANLVTPFIQRIYSYRKFYSKEIRDGLKNEVVTKEEISKAFGILWYTARRSGINMLGHYVTTQAGTFLCGLFLSLTETAEWGLMLQLYGVVAGFSRSIVMSQMPEYSKCYIRGERGRLIESISDGFVIFLLISICGILTINIAGPFVLNLIHSNTHLPSSSSLMWVYGISLLLLNNAQNFANIMSSNNRIPSPTATLVTALAIIILEIVTLKLLDWRLWSLVISPLVAGMAYTWWKWPQIVLTDLRVSYMTLLKVGSERWFSRVYNMVLTTTTKH